MTISGSYVHLRHYYVMTRDGKIFTAQYTTVQSAVLRLHVVCPSVCDVGGSEPHRLEILETKLHGQLAQHLRSS